MGSLAGLAKPDETALQLYARNYVEPVQTGTRICPAVMPGQLLEIAGRSGCGKSTFLLQVSFSLAILCSKPACKKGKNISTEASQST